MKSTGTAVQEFGVFEGAIVWDGQLSDTPLLCDGNLCALLVVLGVF